MKGEIYDTPVNVQGYTIEIEGVAFALDNSTPECPQRVVLEVHCIDANTTGQRQNLALTIEDAEFLIEAVKDVLNFHRAQQNNAN